MLNRCSNTKGLPKEMQSFPDKPRIRVQQFFLDIFVRKESSIPTSFFFSTPQLHGIIAPNSLKGELASEAAKKAEAPPELPTVEAKKLE